MEGQDDVSQVLLFADLGPGTLMLVECADGSLRVLRDERPMDGCRWRADDVAAAAAAFHELAARLDGKGPG